ncbi:hypothetical protein AB0B63_07270 [Micromonospora sp. NPDC049081]|uniref:hypothetical protein n=1 Tax=Micromonospora sp. NPDC049081 TaxID=3155150 RepID=UPI0033FF9E97
MPAPVTKKYGHLTVTASRTVEGGYAINVYAGAERIDALCSTTADRDLYRARYAAIRDHARQGHTAEQVAAHINAPAVAAVAEAEQVITRSLADIATTGQFRQVRPTMAGAHLTPLTGPQQKAINAHRAGVVYVGDGITAATLRALARKGYGTLTFEGRRKRVVSLALTKQGMAAVKAVAA